MVGKIWLDILCNEQGGQPLYLILLCNLLLQYKFHLQIGIIVWYFNIQILHALKRDKAYNEPATISKQHWQLNYNILY